MDRKNNKMADSILSLTLEIISCLTGEDYTVVKKTSSELCQAPVGTALSPIIETSPQSPIQVETNDQIVKLANKIIELLTGEVPIRYQDITVYFSMEEWEYIEGHKDLHKDLYKDIILKGHQPLTSSDGCTKNSESHFIAQDTHEEHAINLDIPSVQRHNDSSTVKHKNSHRNGVYNQSAYQRKKPSLSCSECGKFFTFKSTLVMHQQTHTREKLFSCTECGKCYNNKHNLIEYQGTHSGKMPFSCPECEKYFPRKANLVAHQRTHIYETKYSCSECEKCFHRKSDLIKHQRTHKLKKPFSCPECGKCFLGKANLVAHQRIHIEKTKYSCSECEQRFYRKSNFDTHQRTHT
ncbi:oocyte zinc finger protein XlCOF8.4-like [Dendropsophus ebraccatus]|uniref:oocyte zinc finger protein XlCOF8.4-like n=1 Tax=Dendropsophus ebraccatus TaxID=150705 RepID=UPI0038315B37